MKKQVLKILNSILTGIATFSLALEIIYPYGGLDDVIYEAKSGELLLHWIGMERLGDSPLVYKAYFLKLYLLIYIPIIWILLINIIKYINKYYAYERVYMMIIAGIISVSEIIMILCEKQKGIDFTMINKGILIDIFIWIGWSVYIYIFLMLVRIIWLKTMLAKRGNRSCDK